MANDLSAIAGVLQVFIGGQYEGTLNDVSFNHDRPITQTGMCNGRNARGVGIEKPSMTFSRPMLKTSIGQQVAISVLDGPVDVDFIWPGTDQQWRLPNFQRTAHGIRHNPEQGNTSESFGGVFDKPFRVK